MPSINTPIHYGFPGDGVNPLLVFEYIAKENRDRVDVSGLDMLKHGGYDIDICKDSSATSSIYVAVNNILTTGQYAGQFLYGTGAVSSAARFLNVSGLICAYSGSGKEGIGRGKYLLTPCPTGGYFVAGMVSQVRGVDTSGSTIDFAAFGTHTVFAVDNVHTLNFNSVSDAVNGIGRGTEIRVYRRR